MGGISTGVGIFSGIDTGSLIEQLIASQSRPQILASQRLVQLQSQKSAYLDLNSRLNALKTAAAAFRTGNAFDVKKAVSSDEDVLTATASGSAINGTYNFIVDRLTTTQQLLSRGFADRDSTAVGLSELTFEGVEARLDRDTALADLNNGDGISRGKIKLNNVEVDLSRVETVGELLDEINNAGTGATASVSNGSITLEGVTSLSNVTGYNVLSSIGLGGTVSSTMTGSVIYGLGTNTALSTLNDGRGVGVRDVTGEGVFDFNITVDGTAVGVRIGQIQEINDDDDLVTIEGAASSTGQVIERINDALTAAGFTDVTASIDEANGRIVINNAAGRSIEIADITTGSTTARTATDLGIATSGPVTDTAINGRRVLAGLNTTLLSSINGGRGLDGAVDPITFETASGASIAVDISSATTLSEVIDLINSDPANDDGLGNRLVTATLNSKGNGISISDNTTGVNDLVISGDTAAALGIDGTFADNATDGSNLQLAYLGNATLLANLNNGEGIGTGTFRITDSFSESAEITINENDKTLGDVIRKINSAGLSIQARLNDTGDGLLIEETGTTPGGAKIKIEDTSGGVAKNLRIAGETSGTDTENFIDGSYEITVEFEPTDTLQDIVRAINEAAPGVRASIINDGAGANPFRMSIVSAQSGRDGRFIIDTGGFDLGLNTLEEGQNARVFYGSTDPARGVLLSNNTNSFDGVIEGVSLDINRVSDDPVTISITTDSESIEKKVEAFVSAFNTVIDRIDFQTRYNDETKERGPLLGDGTAIAVRSRLFDALRASNDGFNDTFDRLAQVGITVGEGSKLEFDSEKFAAAYAQDPGAVEDLFTRRDIAERNEDPDGDGIIINDPDAEIEFSALGVIPQLEELIDDYTSTINGTLQNRSNAIDNQIELQRARIDSLQQTLDAKRSILERQFLAMEQAIAQFQTQGSALSQIQLIG